MNIIVSARFHNEFYLTKLVLLFLKAKLTSYVKDSGEQYSIIECDPREDF